MPDSAQHLFDLAQEKIPRALRPQVEAYWHNFREHLARFPQAQRSQWLAELPRVFATSDFVAHTCLRHPELLRELIETGELARAYEAGELARRVARALSAIPDEASLKARLRRLRRREMLRIAFRDLAGWANLAEVTAVTSELAEASLEGALAQLYEWACQRHGTPRGAARGAPQRLVVLGLGKLGGRELNFSSDIDLIFCYPEDGETDGEQVLSNHEFFVRLGQVLINVLNEPTADGFVFRVDMRLRPHGASGALVLSFGAMEQYYQLHGRDWERYALIKARVVAGDRERGAELLERLRPFVYRRYLDFGTIEALRGMKAMIAREVMRKGLIDDIKLGPGGIREVEFIVQALQLIRGGREPPLQEPQLLAVLPRLAARGHLAVPVKDTLAEAYVLLRNIEHRLQMLADAQTQRLPREALERTRIAFAAGYPDWESFTQVLARHRGVVQGLFAQMFSDGRHAETERETATFERVWPGGADARAAEAALQAAGYAEPAAVLTQLTALRDSWNYRALTAEGRQRVDRIVPRLLAAAARTADPSTVLARLMRLIEAIGRRTAYLALLVENPQVLSQLVTLMAASPWIANWIARHPILLDELIDPRSLSELPERSALREELRERLAHVPPGDLELTMEQLRECRHAHLLRVAAADIGPGLAPEKIGAALATVADAVIEAGLEVASEDLARRHGRPRCGQRKEPAGFAVIGYGKLGSRELGYASDLDIIFLYEGCEDGGTNGARPLANEQFFARLGQRLIHILTTRTAAGALYEVDMRLRPSGRSGLLVTSVAAFRDYQLQQAWTWEHQALVRARAIAGAPAVTAALEAIRREALCLPRDAEKLAAEVRDMRRRMVEAHGSREPEQFDVKQDRGGIVDIEFMVQYWILRWAQAYPALTRYTDNLNILDALVDAGLLEPQRREVLAGAYRRYLAVSHKLKLMERGERIAREELADLPAQVERIWVEVLGEG